MQFYGILDQTEFEKEIEQRVNEQIQEDKYYQEQYYSGETSPIKNFIYELDESQIETFRDYAIEDLLVEKGIIKRDFANEKMKELENNPNLDFIPTFEDFKQIKRIPPKLSENIYNSLVSLFDYKTISPKFSFFRYFNEKTYGKGYMKAKKHALKEFKRIFGEINFVEEQTLFEAGNRIQTLGKILQLYDQKLYLLGRINGTAYLPFLYGNLDLYKTSPYYDELLFDQITLFQAKVDILLQLNNEYKFEKDIHFNKILYYRVLALDLGEKFTSEEAFVFTLYTINSWLTIKQAELYSLYDFLETEELYNGSEQNFFRIVEIEFHIKFTKFRKPPSNRVNLKHKQGQTKEFETAHSKRVKSYESKWDLFCEEYYPED